MKKILLVEDDGGIREVEKDYLIKEGYNVVEAEDGFSAIEKFNSEKPDIVVLDLNLPKMDGVNVCKTIRSKSGVPIIMVTARTKEADELLGLDIGADDYVKKPFSPRILVSRVKSLLARPEMVNATKILEVGNLKINMDKRVLLKNDEEVNITTVQLNILYRLAQSPGRVFERYELIDQAYGSADIPEIFDRTIDSHVKNIRKLIEDDPKNPKYILTIRGAGYKFNESL